MTDDHEFSDPPKGTWALCPRPLIPGCMVACFACRSDAVPVVGIGNGCLRQGQGEVEGEEEIGNAGTPKKDLS